METKIDDIKKNFINENEEEQTYVLSELESDKKLKLEKENEDEETYVLSELEKDDDELLDDHQIFNQRSDTVPNDKITEKDSLDDLDEPTAKEFTKKDLE